MTTKTETMNQNEIFTRIENLENSIDSTLRTIRSLDSSGRDTSGYEKVLERMDTNISLLKTIASMQAVGRDTSGYEAKLNPRS
jgi:hypothetical protein